jgi:hypothetical protein
MPDVAAKLHDKIAGGLLPIPTEPPGKVWVGHGDGRACDVCDEPITTTDLEYEIDLADRTLRFHSKCLTAWHQERIDRRAV